MGAAAIPVAIGISAASTLYGAYSANEQKKIAKAAGERNALIAEQAASDAEGRGAVEASRVRSAGVRAMDKARAAMLAQGMDASGAGLNDLLVGMGINIETDALTTRNNAARQAWGYRNQADTSRFEGEAAAYRAEQEMYGSLLTGAGQATSIYAGTRKPSTGSTTKPTDGLATKETA
jgi:hypothetical protein